MRGPSDSAAGALGTHAAASASGLCSVRRHTQGAAERGVDACASESLAADVRCVRLPPTRALIMPDLFDEIFSLSPQVRYVALVHGEREPTLKERPGLVGASSAESDRYEELLVNPTVLTLIERRGRIDCGGLAYVIIRYGNFFQILHALPDGHLSVAVEPDGDPWRVVEALRPIVGKLRSAGAA